MEEKVIEIFNEIVKGIDLKANHAKEYLFYNLSSKFIQYEKDNNVLFEKNMVYKIIKPLYFNLMDELKIKELIKNLHESTKDANSVMVIRKHEISENIWKYGFKILKPLYEMIDEYPITCIVLSGELIRLGLMPKFYKEENRNNIKNMVQEYKTIYLEYEDEIKDLTDYGDIHRKQII